MPQFDFGSFFVQAFWLTLGYCSFFIVYLRFVLVQTFLTLRSREKLLVLSSRISAKLAETGISTKVIGLA